MPISHTLLGLLEREPMHGYRLRQRTREFAWIYPMASASIYPALHDLEKKGFVEHREEIHSGRARKVYEITEEGRNELARWLCGAPGQPLTLRDRTVLQLSMQTDATISRSRSWIEQQIERLSQEVERQERRLKDDADEQGSFERLSLEYGVGMLKLRMGYFQRLVEQAEAKPAVGGRASTSTSREHMAASASPSGSML